MNYTPYTTATPYNNTAPPNHPTWLQVYGYLRNVYVCRSIPRFLAQWHYIFSSWVHLTTSCVMSVDRQKVSKRGKYVVGNHWHGSSTCLTFHSPQKWVMTDDKWYPMSKLYSKSMPLAHLIVLSYPAIFDLAQPQIQWILACWLQNVDMNQWKLNFLRWVIFQDANPTFVRYLYPLVPVRSDYIIHSGAQDMTACKLRIHDNSAYEAVPLLLAYFIPYNQS